MPTIDTCDESLIKALQAYQSIKNQNFNIPDGLCFGSALCHNIFAYLGKLKCWQAVLEAVVTWNQSLDILVEYSPRALNQFLDLVAPNENVEK